MYKKFLLSLFMLLISFKASAFYMQAEVNWGPARASAVVRNFYAGPLICSGNVEASTMSGYYTYGYMNSIVIYPGNYVYISAFARNPYFDPITYAVSQIDCFFW